MKFPQASLKKVSILFAVLLLTITLGSGMNKAFAGQGIQSLLTNWFDSKKDASIQQIDQEITSEKNRLMVELKDAVSADIQRADAELAQFTEDEITLRVGQLQSYADELIKNLHINNPAEKAKIKADLDAALEQAKNLLDNAVPVKPPVSPPGQGNGNDNGKGKGNTSNVNEKDSNTVQQETVKPEVESKKAGKEQEITEDNNTEVKDEGSSTDKENKVAD